MTLETVTEIYQESLSLFEAQQNITIDLSKIDAFDSSIMSLMLSWLRYAKQKTDKHITFISIPDGLRDLIKESKLDKTIRTN